MEAFADGVFAIAFTALTRFVGSASPASSAPSRPHTGLAQRMFGYPPGTGISWR